VILATSAALIYTSPLRQSTPNVWYTQIGQWHLQRKDSLSGKPFFFHDSRVDGARSGQATANVRYNFNFEDIRRYEARLVLGPAPASAGLLVQNRQVTYYFFIEKAMAAIACDSLRICRYRENRTISLFAAAAKVPDTVNLTLSFKTDSLFFNASRIMASIAKPTDFPEPAVVGFECLQGTVKIVDAKIEARNAVVKENFEKATLVNLHLDKMLGGSGKKVK
jgi:hypothetical protein